MSPEHYGTGISLMTLNDLNISTLSPTDECELAIYQAQIKNVWNKILNSNILDGSEARALAYYLSKGGVELS